MNASRAFGETFVPMKVSGTAETPLVRRYGVRKAKLVAQIWFFFMYAFLVVATAGLWILSPEFSAGWRRIVIGCLASGLIVAAVALLTRMRLEHFAAIERLELEKSAS